MRRRVLLAAGLLTAVVAIATSAAAQQGSLRVLASNGPRAAIEALQAQAESLTGRRLEIAYGTSASTKQRIVEGETFDVAILTSDVLDELTAAGKITAASRVTLGKSGIGVGARSGAPKPDIRSRDALKASLLGARSLTWASDGASRPHITRMLETLGIADAVKAKTTLEQGSVRAAGRVARGEAELLITLVSEILPIEGIELVGPLPAEFQNYVKFGAALSADTANAAPGRALVAFLSGPEARKTFTAKGITNP